MAHIGGYEVVEQAQSAEPVLKAFDEAAGRFVALREQPGLDETKLQFDAMILGMLDHPNIARVFNTIAEDGLWYLVREWVDGADLGSIRDRAGRLTVPQSITVVRGALRGLAFAHNRQIVHGDVSPSNILVSVTGESKLVEFGVAARARLQTGANRLAGVGLSKYCSPEVWAGAPATKRSDVFSAAAVLADLLGVRPGRGHFDLSGLDRSIAGVLAGALAENPDVRPAAAAQLLEDLEGAADRLLGVDWPDETALSDLAVASMAQSAESRPISSAVEVTSSVSAARSGPKHAAEKPRFRWWWRSRSA